MSSQRTYQKERQQDVDNGRRSGESYDRPPKSVCGDPTLPPVARPPRRFIAPHVVVKNKRMVIVLPGSVEG